MIERIVVSILTNLGTWLLGKVLEMIQKRQLEDAADKKVSEEIDRRLDAMKDALKESLDGEEITPEQSAKLKRAISDFIRGPSGV